MLTGYDGVLLDAWGVLFDSSGRREGASELLAWLAQRSMPCAVITNTAASQPAAVAARIGVRVSDASDARASGNGSDPVVGVVTSGYLLVRFFAEQGLVGRRSRVLGGESSVAYVRQAGGVIANPGEPFDVLVIADEEGYPFAATMGEVLTTVIRQTDAGSPPTLLAPNPDCLYVRGNDSFGIASGSVAALVEAALSSRYGADAPRCHRLGKPGRAMFDEACAWLGSRNVLVVGDQLETDIRGAHAAGLDAALLLGGVGLAPEDDAEVVPEFVITTLHPDRLQTVRTYA